MSFRADAIRGSNGRGAAGQVDYRLARNAVITEFKKGRLSKIDVCDAHPELERAAREVGKPTTEVCPICEEADLVLVSYVFGPRLPPHGRCITTPRELSTLSRRATTNTCYVVEVCPECSWNHLARMFTLGGSAAANS